MSPESCQRGHLYRVDNEHKCRVIQNSSPLMSSPSSSRKLGQTTVEPATFLTNLETRYSILLVDDESINRKLLARYLQFSMLDVTMAVDGGKAVEEYKSAVEAGKPFLCVFMDVNMPVMDGMTATRRILAINANTNSSTDVVMTTGNVLAPEIAAYKAAGAENVMMKPFSRAAVLALVVKFISRSIANANCTDANADFNSLESSPSGKSGKKGRTSNRNSTTSKSKSVVAASNAVKTATP
jgi:CheY-like chemotaxis protein